MAADRDAAALEAALGHPFHRPDLLALALQHRSFGSESPHPADSNERLEFLGDAVLSVVVATELLESYDLAEGEMAKVRAAVVSEPVLAAVARAIGLGDHLLLGRGEEATGGRDKPSILADALEAVIGALYLDGGLEAAASFVLGHWRDRIAERTAAPGMRDYKTRLQEVLARDGIVPAYETIGTGPDHQRVFSSEVSSGGVVVGRGSGTSKKRAEQAAAEDALESLGDA